MHGINGVSKAYAGEIPVTICRAVHSRDVAPLHAIKLPIIIVYVAKNGVLVPLPDATIYSAMAVTVIQIKSAWFIS